MAYSFFTKEEPSKRNQKFALLNKFYEEDPHFTESQKYLMESSNHLEKVIELLNDAYDVSVGLERTYSKGIDDFIKTAKELKHDIEGYE